MFPRLALAVLSMECIVLVSGNEVEWVFWVHVAAVELLEYHLGKSQPYLVELDHGSYRAVLGWHFRVVSKQFVDGLVQTKYLDPERFVLLRKVVGMRWILLAAWDDEVDRHFVLGRKR
jgi:hypothetical protein